MPIDPAVSGLIGAGIGAIAGMSGTLMGQVLQSKREHKKWLLTRKEDAYSNSLKYLLRVLNKRSKLTADGIAVLAKEDVPEWFSDLSEAQAWITSLTIYCSDDVRETIKSVSSKFNGVMSMLMGNNVYISSGAENRSMEVTAHPGNGLDNLAETVSFVYLEILKCAQRELGEHIQ